MKLLFILLLLVSCGKTKTKFVEKEQVPVDNSGYVQTIVELEERIYALISTKQELDVTIEELENELAQLKGTEEEKEKKPKKEKKEKCEV